MQRIFGSKIDDSIYEYIPKNIKYFSNHFLSEKNIKAFFPKYNNLTVRKLINHKNKNNNELKLNSQTINSNTIPSNIKTLLISQSSQSICDFLPNTLIKLRINNFSGKIEKPLPSNLKYLVINYEFNQPIQGLIPDKIRYLALGKQFYQSLENCLPTSLRYLGISKKCYELNKYFISEDIYVEFIDVNNINNQFNFDFNNL